MSACLLYTDTYKHSARTHARTRARTYARARAHTHTHTHTQAGAVRRVHFHEFMLKVHADLHEYKATSERGSPRAIPAVAESTAREARVLCLDEFQVTDIADAAILAQLLDSMWRAGVCVVATSNR
jgi:predicted ATPase